MYPVEHTVVKRSDTAQVALERASFLVVDGAVQPGVQFEQQRRGAGRRRGAHAARHAHHAHVAHAARRRQGRGRGQGGERSVSMHSFCADCNHGHMTC